jgi:type IV fimbrial biogenesis protein FimT
MTIHPPKIRSRGFTLIELMITVSIAAILMMVAVPSFTAYRRNAELTSVANKVIGSINAARGEAMKRGMSALVVPLDNGASWNAGWVAFVDKSATRTRTYDASAEGTVAIQQAVPTGITVTGNGTAEGAVPYIMFDASGFSRTKAGGFGALALEVKRTDVATTDQPEQTRFVIISSTGRVRVCKPTSASDANCKALSKE